MDNVNLEELKSGLEKATKKQLETFAFYPIKNFLVSHVNLFRDKLEAISIHFKRIPSKQSMIELLVDLYSDKMIAKTFIESMDLRRRELLELALWVENVHFSDVLKLYPKIEVKKKSYYGSELTVYDHEGFLEEWKDLLYYQNDYFYSPINLDNVFFRFPYFLRLLLSIHLPKPEGYYLEPIEGDQLDDNYLIVNFEKAIFEELPILFSYNLQQKINYSVKGYPLQRSVKKMAANLRIAEAEPYQKYHIRAGMLAGLIGSFLDPVDINRSPLANLEWLFGERLPQNIKYPYLFPYLTGFGKYNEFEITARHFTDLKEMLVNISDQRWIKLDNLLKYLEYRFYDFNPFAYYYYHQKISPDLKFFDSDEIYRLSLSARKCGSDGFIRACIYLFASWGLFELALDPKVPVIYSVYDKIMAFRLTDLGAYIFKKTDTYEQPQESKNKLIFADDSPTIKVDGSIDWARAILDNVADQVSINRFKFSPGKFLSDVNNRQQLKNKIMLFKEVIGEDLPVYWEKYFEQLVKNTKAVQPVHLLSVYQLPIENKDLIKLVASDIVLRKLIVKAEDFKVLVEKSNLRKFKNRMQELGYLIDD